MATTAASGGGNGTPDYSLNFKGEVIAPKGSGKVIQFEDTNKKTWTLTLRNIQGKITDTEKSQIAKTIASALQIFNIRKGKDSISWNAEAKTFTIKRRYFWGLFSRTKTYKIDNLARDILRGKISSEKAHVMEDLVNLQTELSIPPLEKTQKVLLKDAKFEFNHLLKDPKFTAEAEQLFSDCTLRKDKTDAEKLKYIGKKIHELMESKSSQDKTLGGDDLLSFTLACIVSGKVKVPEFLDMIKKMDISAIKKYESSEPMYILINLCAGFEAAGIDIYSELFPSH